jgi:hypothetical protein
MTYAIRLYTFILIACVLASVAAAPLANYGLIVVLAFAALAGYLEIIIGSWIFGRKNQ